MSLNSAISCLDCLRIFSLSAYKREAYFSNSVFFLSKSSIYLCNLPIYPSASSNFLYKFRLVPIAFFASFLISFRYSSWVLTLFLNSSFSAAKSLIFEFSLLMVALFASLSSSSLESSFEICSVCLAFFASSSLAASPLSSVPYILLKDACN